jgi:hypothetical protein
MDGSSAAGTGPGSRQGPAAATAAAGVANVQLSARHGHAVVQTGTTRERVQLDGGIGRVHRYMRTDAVRLSSPPPEGGGRSEEILGR